jgi:hypothetical protein
MLVTALSTMLAVPTASGQAIFGKQYKSYDYFIVKHAVAVNDPRGDQVGCRATLQGGAIQLRLAIWLKLEGSVEKEIDVKWVCHTRNRAR